MTILERFQANKEDMHPTDYLLWLIEMAVPHLKSYQRSSGKLTCPDCLGVAFGRRNYVTHDPECTRKVLLDAIKEVLK